ncbi:MAG: NEW3 domain-containing protein [Candidatus Thermoplasmatota archaeon]|nr:NEW3 domain-containing protein [Candidatus Thermoplasmatota archaeon]MEE3083559.1 NEW3 domain-containing protein [Candidatus Thermoplasmatota archaeon]
MESQRRRSFSMVLLLFLSTLTTAFIPAVSADDRILLDLSSDHVTLMQGDSTNVTITVENNDSAIHDFNLSLDSSLTPSAWNVTLADTTMHQLGPAVFGFSNSTTVIVRLASNATLADHGSVTIVVNRSGTTISSAITLYLSVAPSYLPSINNTVVGDAGLITMETGAMMNLSIPISNLGSATDHLVLSVDEEPDLSGFWASWTGGSSGNNGTGNNTGGNNTGNGTGNNTGGNNTGNGTGNNTGGNNTGNGTGNVSVGPTEFSLNLTVAATNLTAVLDSVNLSSNGSYLVNWVLQENGSILPDYSGVYNWTSDGSNHSWNSTWNLTTGEWCFSADLTHNLTPEASVSSCANVTASSSGGGSSISRSIPSGWDVRWIESTLANMSAGEERMATLRVSVPNGEAPGDYGFTLSAGSAMGNFSISETIVVHVNGTHNLTLAADDGGMLWLPNATSTVVFTVENAGTSEAEAIYSLTDVIGHCTASLVVGEANGDRLDNGESDTFVVNVSINPASHEGDTCELVVEAWDEIGEVTYSHSMLLTLGRTWGFSLQSVEDNLTLSPGGTVAANVQILNTGTEVDCIRLNVEQGVSGVNITSNQSYAQVNRGEVIDLSISASATSDTLAVGTHTIHLIADCSSSNTTVDIFTNLTILPWSSIRMAGPLGGAFDVDANAPTLVNLTLNNDGTGPANATLDWSGAPAGFTITPSNETTVEPGNASTMSLSVAIDDDVASGTYSFTIMALNPVDGSTWDSISVAAQVDQRAEVRLLIATNSLPVSSRADVSFNTTIINDGNEADTFSLNLQGANGFEVSITPQNIQLGAGQSADVMLSLRRAGAQGDVTMILTVTSQSDEDVTDSVNITATFPNVEVRTTLATTGTEVTADGQATMTLFLENLGEAQDTLLVTGPTGFNCNHPAQITLDAGSPASSHTVICSPISDLLAGTHWVNFTSTSLADASQSSTASTQIDVLPTRTSSGDPMISVEFSGDDWSLPWNSSATYTVTVINSGNEQVNGFLLLTGEHALEMYPEWTLVESGNSISLFSVAPGASSTYSLSIRPVGWMDVGIVDLRIEASGTLDDGHGFSIASNTVQITVEHEPDDPTEAVLWEGGPMVNAANLAIAMIAGWVVAALLVLWMRRSSQKQKKKTISDAWIDAGEEEKEEEKESDLKEGEVRADDDGTARCHACDSRIRLPKEKEPPFRFKCPTCSVMNRVVEPADSE